MALPQAPLPLKDPNKPMNSTFQKKKKKKKQKRGKNNIRKRYLR
jgi:hypothetical protein